MATDTPPDHTPHELVAAILAAAVAGDLDGAKALAGLGKPADDHGGDQ
jgi:hypothetical protein